MIFRNNIYALLLAIIASSCSKNNTSSVEDIIATNDIALLQKKKKELAETSQQIAQQIKTLEQAIKRINPQEKLPLVTVFSVKDTVFNHFVQLQGNVTTKQNMIIYPEYIGVLERVFVKKGQYVTKGEVIAKINDGGLSQQITGLQIQADLAKTTYQRQKRLWEQKIGSEIEYLQTKASYEAQLKAIKQLEEQIAKTQVKAPFSGTIDDVITEQGSVVSTGISPLFRIINLGNMYIKTDVPERYLPTITKGKHVKAYFSVLNKDVDAKVKQVSNYINPANRTFETEITILDKKLSIKPNLTAKLKINDYTNKKAILIPQSIISEDAEGQQYVYTITKKQNQQGVVKRNIITTGKTEGDYIEVLSGIASGENIVEEGARSVKEGQKVKILSI